MSVLARVAASTSTLCGRTPTHWRAVPCHVCPRRGLGWLLGPPPKPFSKEERVKISRLSMIGIAVVVVSILYNDQLRGRVYDEEGNFSPRVRIIPYHELEVELEKEALARNEKREKVPNIVRSTEP